jgi:hypothetical protein
MALPDWILKFKEAKTEIKFIKGVYYKYAVSYHYNSSKGRTDKITGHLLGKITFEEGFVPSSKHLLRYKETTLPSVDIKMFGLYHLFNQLFEKEEMEGMYSLFDVNIVETLLTVAMMRFAFQSPIKRMANYHAHDYCSQDWLKKGTDDKKISLALKTIGENRGKLVEWMRKRLTQNEINPTEFVMIDSTHIPSSSENIHINAVGYNPSHSFDSQIRLMYIFSTQMKQPVYYRLINGNITDLTSMKHSIDEMNIQNVVYIADKGFYSAKNIAHLKENHLQYIIPLHRNNQLINFEPLQEPNFKRTSKTYFIYQGRTIWYYSYQNQGQQMVTFLDERLRVEEENDYLLRTKSYPEEYTEEKFYERLTQFGTLTLIYELEKMMTEEQIYIAYKQRNEIEMVFDSYKNFLEADKMYMQNRYVLEGWLMANFIAMIAYYRLYNKLKDAELLAKYSPKDIVEISKSIFKAKINDHWKTTEITKKNLDLFLKLKIDYLI